MPLPRPTNANPPAPETTLAWLLRIGVAGCFIGHGAFGVITKAAWVPYFAATGISEPLAWQLMPWVGWMDISIGVLVLLWPCRALFTWAAGWAIWTALLRPLAGEPFWETLERAGNYGVPIAILAWVGLRGGWFARLPSGRWPELTDDKRLRLNWALRLATCTLLVGHAGLGFFVEKAGLTHHYTSAWANAPADTVVWIGAFEFVLAALVLLRPVTALLLGVCAWKLATESLFLVAGAPAWELIERAGSYIAPLTLALLILHPRTEHATTRDALAAPA